MAKAQPKFKAEPCDESPVLVESPSLVLCSVSEQCLTIPADVRARYLACPVRAPEWKSLLAAFDAKWGKGSAAQPSSNTGQEAAAATASTSTAVTADAGSGAESGAFDWGSVFPDEPNTRPEFITKYGSEEGHATFSLGPTLAATVVDGPKLFLISTGDSEVDTELPVVTFGAGTWLLDAKAAAYAQDSQLCNQRRFQKVPKQPPSTLQILCQGLKPHLNDQAVRSAIGSFPSTRSFNLPQFQMFLTTLVFETY